MKRFIMILFTFVIIAIPALQASGYRPKGSVGADYKPTFWNRLFYQGKAVDYWQQQAKRMGEKADTIGAYEAAGAYQSPYAASRPSFARKQAVRKEQLQQKAAERARRDERIRAYQKLSRAPKFSAPIADIRPLVGFPVPPLRRPRSMQEVQALEKAYAGGSQNLVPLETSEARMAALNQLSSDVITPQSWLELLKIQQDMQKMELDVQQMGQVLQQQNETIHTMENALQQKERELQKLQNISQRTPLHTQFKYVPEEYITPDMREAYEQRRPSAVHSYLPEQKPTWYQRWGRVLGNQFGALKNSFGGNNKSEYIAPLYRDDFDEQERLIVDNMSPERYVDYLNGMSDEQLRSYARGLGIKEDLSGIDEERVAAVFDTKIQAFDDSLKEIAKNDVNKAQQGSDRKKALANKFKRLIGSAQ